MPADPCPTCPWRTSNPPGGKNIPSFNIELMRGLQNTVGREDGFRPIMACHYSACGGETACVGYVAVEGMRNLNVRILMLKGVIDPAGLKAGERAELWESFGAMLEAYEEAIAST